MNTRHPLGGACFMFDAVSSQLSVIACACLYFCSTFSLASPTAASFWPSETIRCVTTAHSINLKFPTTLQCAAFAETNVSHFRERHKRSVHFGMPFGRWRGWDCRSRSSQNVSQALTPRGATSIAIARGWSPLCDPWGNSHEAGIRNGEPTASSRTTVV